MFLYKFLIFIVLFIYFENGIFATTSQPLNDQVTEVVADTTELNTDQDEDIQSLFDKYEKSFITNTSKTIIGEKFNEDNITDSVNSSTDHVIASVQNIVGEFQANVENNEDFPVEILDDTNTNYKDLALVHHDELSFGHPDYVEVLKPKHNTAPKMIESKTLEKTENEQVQTFTTPHYSSIETTTPIITLHKSVETTNEGIIVNENNSTSVRPNIFSNMASIIRNAIGTLIKRRYPGRNFNNQNLNDKYNNDDEDLMLNDATTIEALLVETDQLGGKSEEEIRVFEISDDKVENYLKQTTTENTIKEKKIKDVEATLEYETTSIAYTFDTKKKEDYLELKTFQPTTTIKTKDLDINNDLEETQFITEHHQDIKDESLASVVPEIFQENIYGLRPTIYFNVPKEEETYIEMITHQPTTKIQNEEIDYYTISNFGDTHYVTEKQQEIKKEFVATEVLETLQKNNNEVQSSFDVIFPKVDEQHIEMEAYPPTTTIKTEEKNLKINSDLKETQFVTEKHENVKDNFLTPVITEKLQDNNIQNSSSTDVIFPKVDEKHIEIDTYQPTTTVRTEEKSENINSDLKETQFVAETHKVVKDIFLSPVITEQLQKKNKEAPSFFDYFVPKLEEKLIEMETYQPTSTIKTEEKNLNIKPSLNETNFAAEKHTEINKEFAVPEVAEKSQEKNLNTNQYLDVTPSVEEHYEMEAYYPTTTIKTEDIPIKSDFEGTFVTENKEVVKNVLLPTIVPVPVKVYEKISEVSSSFNIVFPKEEDEDEKYFQTKTFNPPTTFKPEESILNINPRVKESYSVTEKQKEIKDELVGIKVPVKLQEAIVNDTEKFTANHNAKANSSFNINIPTDKVYFENADLNSTIFNSSTKEKISMNSKVEEIRQLSEKHRETNDNLNVTKVPKKPEGNTNNHRENDKYSSTLIDQKDIGNSHLNTNNTSTGKPCAKDTENKYVDTVNSSDNVTVATTFVPELLTILTEDHFEEKIITNNDFKSNEKFDMELHVISEENYQVPDIKENKNNYNAIETTNEKLNAGSSNLNLFDILSGNEATIYNNAIHDYSSLSVSEDSRTEMYEQSTEYYNRINHISVGPTTEKLPLTSSSSSSSSESVSIENTNDTDAYILQSVTVKGVTIWELTAKPIQEDYDNIKSELTKKLNIDYNSDLEKSTANENVLVEDLKINEKSYRDARTLGQIQESDFIEERDTLKEITTAAEMDLKRNEAFHTVTKKDGVDEIKLNNFESIEKLINLENADVIDEIIYKNIANESEHHLINDHIHEATETTVSRIAEEFTTPVVDVDNNINFNNSRTIEENDEPVTTKDVFKTIVDAVELSTDLTKTIENFHDVMDKNSAILEASNQIISSKKTREMFEFGIDNFNAQEITNNTKNIINDSDFVEYIIIGMCSLVALTAVLTALVIAIQKARAYNILDLPPA